MSGPRYIASGIDVDAADRPRMPRHPNQKADDMGARLAEPSLLSVLISTTGVPKQRMPGWR